MMAAAVYILIMDVLMAFLAIVSSTGNGFLLFTIFANKNLRKNDSLYLIAALSIADFLLALLLLPFISFLIIGWDRNANFTYNAKPMLLLNIPIVFEIKLNSVLTVAIAFDRFSALQWPIRYRLRRRTLYTAGAVLVGILWGTFDVALNMATAPFEPNPGCAAAGCFFDPHFRYYRGVSDMLINAFSVGLTGLVYFKIRYLKVHPSSGTFNNNNNNNSSENENAKFVHANRIVLSVLLCSGVCIFVPSIFSGLGEMIGFQAFLELGPFIAVGLLASGVGNAFIFGVRHTLIRQAIRSMWKKSNEQQSRALRDVQNIVRA